MRNLIKKIIHFLSKFANCMKEVDPETHTRRKQLKAFAKQIINGTNKAEDFALIVEHGISLVKGLPNPSKKLVADLKAVLIGKNMTICRGKGAYFVGNIIGSQGFKKELQDPWNQVQHATAGIVIAFQYGKMAEIIVKILETEIQDDLLYDVTFPLGEKLNDDNYIELAIKLRKAIGSA